MDFAVANPALAYGVLASTLASTVGDDLLLPLAAFGSVLWLFDDGDKRKETKGAKAELEIEKKSNHSSSMLPSTSFAPLLLR